LVFSRRGLETLHRWPVGQYLMKQRNLVAVIIIN
jgi:hypothetical protein